MSIWVAIGLQALGLAVLAAAAFGIVKGSMKNYVTYHAHREMCHDKSNETNNQLKTISEDVKQLINAVGFLKGRMEG